MSPQPIAQPHRSDKDILSKREFTWQELSQHNTESDAYIAIRGKVYDITTFIPEHPGGRDTLLLAAGRDATLVSTWFGTPNQSTEWSAIQFQLFETYHPLGVAQRLGKYHIGYLANNELPVFPEPSEFFVTLKKRVQEYFRNTNQDPKNHPLIWVRYAGLIGSLVLSYALLFFLPWTHNSVVLQISFAALLGFLAGEVGQHVLHDGSHFSVTHSPEIWKLFSSVHDFVNGAGHLTWMYQHILGHHPYTNIDGADPDVKTGDPDFRRIKPNQSWYFHYAKQHISGPLLYGFLAMKTRLQDFHVLFWAKSNVNIRVNPIQNKDLAILFAGKAFFIFTRILLPLMVTPYTLGQVLLFLLISDLVLSYWLALVFQVSHIVDEVVWPTPNEKNFVDIDWAKMQVSTTQDYAHDSTFWTVVTGALNYQAVHHLFPGINQHYYPAIGKICKETCIEFGVPFLYKETFLDALKSHFGYLKILARNPLSKSD